MAKITRLSLYVINQVKLRRLVLGYSAERLSILIKRSHGYVLTAENPSLKSQYPAPEFPILAKELEWQVHDLLPSDEMGQTSTGELVDKKILSLNNETDLKLVVSGLIDYGFYKSPKTLNETGKYLMFDSQLQTALLEKVIIAFVKKGKLKREGEGIIEDRQN